MQQIDLSMFEDYNPAQCGHEAQPTRRLLDPVLFPENTPLLTGVKIVARIGFWAETRCGICEVHGQRFYFHDILDGCWRRYDKQYRKPGYGGGKSQFLSRVGPIFAAFDTELEELKSLSLPNPQAYRDHVARHSDAIGIFWRSEIDPSFAEWP